MDKYTLTLFQNFLMQHFTKKDLYYIDNRFLFGDVKDHFKYNPTKYDLVCYLSNPAANINHKDFNNYIISLINFIENEIIPFYIKEKKWKGQTILNIIKKEIKKN